MRECAASPAAGLRLHAVRRDRAPLPLVLLQAPLDELRGDGERRDRLRLLLRLRLHLLLQLLQQLQLFVQVLQLEWR